MSGPNLMLPGNPRYQPESLREFFGYDSLVRGLAEVELAVMDVLAQIGVIPADDYASLTEDRRRDILAIRTGEVDEVERKVTRHDVRAWVRLAQERLPSSLQRWVHVPLTSYDPLDTGRVLVYCRSYERAIRPAIKQTMLAWAYLVEEHASTLQIGRTHGQHALPVTVGFWLGTILGRVSYCLEEMDRSVRLLAGKVSGAVGAYNAQVGLSIDQHCRELLGCSFEEAVLRRVGLKRARVSTQIVQPEPLATFLFSAVMMSAAFGQFGRDARQLMRTEIGEVVDPFEPGQVGSSTMAHKRNPLNFENLDGTHTHKTIWEFGKVLSTMISEHQRDLTASPAYRDFPTILVNLMCQLDTLLRVGKTDKRPFIRRIGINPEACRRNFEMSANVVLAEPIYLALQMAGYEGDAHEVVNHRAMPIAQKSGCSLFDAIETLARDDASVRRAIENVPGQVRELLITPDRYTGRAFDQAMEFAAEARRLVE